MPQEPNLFFVWLREEKQAPGSVHGTNPVGSLLKMSTPHYLARIPFVSCDTAVITSLLNTHMNNRISPGFVDDEH